MKRRTRFLVALLLVSLVLSNLISSGIHALGHLTEEKHHDCGHDHHSDYKPNATDANQDNFESIEQGCDLCSFLVFTGEQPYSFSNSVKAITFFDFGVTEKGQTEFSFVCQDLVSDRAPPYSFS